MQPSTYTYNTLEYRTMNHYPFFLVPGREHSEAPVSEMAQGPEEYSTRSPAQVKLKALEKVRVMKRLVNKASQKTI